MLAFEDNFNGPAGALPNPLLWTPKNGPHTTSELSTFRDTHARLDGQGNLALTVSKEPNDGFGYTGGWVETKGLYEVQYGLLQARMKIPPGAGLWPAFWALGADHDTNLWPACGEIDFAEYIGRTPNVIYGSLHGPKKSDGSAYGLTGSATSYYPVSHDWHIFAARWQPGRVQFIVDGWVYRDFKQADIDPDLEWVFEHPFYLILGMGCGGWAGAVDDAALPATLLVDWVRVYQ